MVTHIAPSELERLDGEELELLVDLLKERHR